MNAEVAADIPSPKLKIMEQCAADSSPCGDLPSGRAGDCNGVKLEGAIGEAESGNGKEDLDGAYVFINGFDVSCEDGVNHNSSVPDPNEDFVGNNGDLKVNGCSDRGEFEEPEIAQKAVSAVDDGDNNSLVQDSTVEDFVRNNGELKVNGCNGLGGSGGQVIEEKAIEVQPHEGVSNGSFVDEVKPGIEVMDSSRETDVLESAVCGQDDMVGLEVIVKEQVAPESSLDVPEEIPESESSNVAATALNDRKEPLENAGEVSDQVDEVSKAEPEEIPESDESSDVAAPAPDDRKEPLENEGEVSDQVDEVSRAEPEEIYESDKSSDVAAPASDDRKEPLENAEEVSDHVDEVPKAEPTVVDSVSVDSELHKGFDHSMDDVDEQLAMESISEVVVDEPKVVVDGKDTSDSVCEVQTLTESFESDESATPYDNGHDLTISTQPIADATSTAEEAQPDPTVDELEIGSTAGISESIPTPIELEFAPPAGEPEPASHGEPDIALSPGRLEHSQTAGDESDTESPTKFETSPTGIKSKIESVESALNAGETLTVEVSIENLDLGREEKEQKSSTDSLWAPSADSGNVLVDVVDNTDSTVHEDKSVMVAEGAARISDNPGPAAELEKRQLVLSESYVEMKDMEDQDAVVGGGEFEICFGSISLKELSAIPTNDRNSDLSYVVHTPRSEQEHTESGAKPENRAVKVEKRFFNYLIKVPRYDDSEKLREQINALQPQIDEQTRVRDAIGVERQKSKALRENLFLEVDAAIKEENAAREPLRSKWAEVAHVQELNNTAKSIDDIDTRIRSLEHTLHHVTIGLKDEKQIMRELKQLRQSREQLSSNMGKQGKQSLEQQEQNEERLKILRKEAELLRDNVSRAELVTRTAKKKLYDEKTRFWDLQNQFVAANNVRQGAYEILKELKEQLRKKNGYFWKYIDQQKLCYDLMNKNDWDSVFEKCVAQVEYLIKLWLEDSKFRDDYIRCNDRSTLRRLGTRDGRALGPNEEPQNISSYTSNLGPVKEISYPPLPSPRPPPSSVSVEAHPTVAETSSVKPVEQQQKKQSASKANNAVKPSESRVLEPLSVTEEEEVVEVAEVPKRTTEEEEMARKAEELRKEEEAAELKEQCRLEEKAKAEAALERKKRNAEKAQARAAAKAQKEAELKEKEREKRLKKKERKNGGNGVAETSSEVESAPSSETSSETPMELETTKERAEAVTRRPQKPTHFTKQQNRVKAMPPNLRNRGKRWMQPWMWAVVAALLVLALFVLGWNLFA